MHVFHSKRLALAALIVVGLVAFLSTHPGIAPAGPVALVVNSTANTSDGNCDGTSCTLREAIADVNDGVTDLIQFDASVFPTGTPGVIDIEGGSGALPPITSDVTIDAAGAGVIIDGDATDDGTGVGPGLAVHGSQAGFNFELLGEGHFALRDITGRGIDVDGETFALDTLTIDAVTIAGTTDDGIFVHNLPYASAISLTDSTITSGNFGMRATMAGPNIPSVGYVVTGNDIVAANADGASGAAVSLNLQTALAPGSTVNFIVEDNPRIRTHGDNGVNVQYCSSGTPCALDHGEIMTSVSGNTLVRSSGDAIHGRLYAHPAPATSTASSISLHVDDNSQISAESDGIDYTSRLCCGADNSQTLTINGNGPISTVPDGTDAIDIETEACCSTDGGVAVEINDNTGGISANEGDAVQLRLLCCGDNSIAIRDNSGPFSSANDNGIRIDTCVEDEADLGPADLDCLETSTALLDISGNTLSANLEDGIHVCCGEFRRGAEHSVISNNSVTNNGRDGIEINSSRGITVGPGNVITGNGTSTAIDDSAIEVSDLVALLFFRDFDALLLTNATITENEISGNGGLGIDQTGFNPAFNPNAPSEAALEFAIVGCNLYPLAATINPNGCLPFPMLSGVASDAVGGSACAGCRVEVFLANDTPPDQDGHGEGATFVTAGNANGSGDFSIDLPCGLKAGALTATATDGDGNSSEFSANLAFSGTSGDCTPAATPTGGASSPTPPTATATPTCACFTPPAVTPTRTATPTATARAALCGDVDGGGSVNSIDAALVLQYSAGLLQTLIVPQGADVNGDGDINSIDAALILQHTAGLLNSLTC